MTILSTNTPLDSWIGGLPLEGLTLVEGPSGAGKTALLRAIAAERVTPSTPTAYISCDQKYLGGFYLQEIKEVMSVVAQLHTLKPKPVILIDDATSYGIHQTEAPARKAKTWANFVRRPQVREHSVILGVQTRNTASPTYVSGESSLGRGPTFAADIILTTEVQASLHNGILLRLTCEKCRWADTAKMAPLLMAIVLDENGWRGEAA